MGLPLLAVKLAVLTVLIGVTVKLVKPELFFKVPHVGFILHAITGGRMPPYFNPEIFIEDGWLQKNDVIIAVGAKCGTNYMMTILHELRTWNLPELREFEDISDVTPWADFDFYPGHKAADHHKLWAQGRTEQWSSKKYPYRAFKTHLFPKTPGSEHPHSVLDVDGKPNVKFIAMTRNPKDVVFSLFSFFATHSEVFRATWGGFPPVFDTFEKFLDFEFPDEPVPIIEYAKRWWQVRDKENVLLLHYSDVTRDPAKYIRKIADFVEVDIPDDALKKVVARVDVSFMKKRNSRYLYRYGEKADKLLMKNETGSIIKKGGTGAYKSTMAKEQEERLDKHVDAALEGEGNLKSWIRTGGEYY